MPQFTPMPTRDPSAADPDPAGREVLRAAPADGASLSPAQQRFNRLLGQLTRARAELLEWQQTDEQLHRVLQDRLLPAEQALASAQRDYLHALDAVLLDPPRGLRLTGRRRAKAEGVVLTLCAALLAQGETEDPDIVAIHDRYSDRSLAERRARHAEEEREFLQHVARQFGVDEGGEGEAAADVEALGARLDEEFAARAARAQAAWAEDPAAQRAERQRQRARERAEAKRAVDLQASVRDIYRKLVRDLHPDRETDPAERARKTGLMQRINQACEAGDLLTLLELQFQFEQLDSAKLAQLSAERLKHYTAVLREQLKAVDEQIRQCTERLQIDFRLPPLLMWRRPVDVTRWLEERVDMNRETAQDLTEGAARLRNPHQVRIELELLIRSVDR